MLENQLLTCQNFLQVFLSGVNPHDQLPVKVSSSSICKIEVIGSVLDWIIQYLHAWSCPDFLVTPLARLILDEIRLELNKPKCPFYNEETNAYVSLPLMQYVVSKVQDVCERYNNLEKLVSLSVSDCILPTATYAVKNKRRQMEDRHVIVNDLAKLFNRQNCEPISYYAVFDGHNGSGAATYSATHLHQFLAESQFFPMFPEQALTDAFKLTDKNLLEKLDAQITRSGTTAVVAVLYHENRMLHVAWVGDSEALISSKGRVQRLVVPHKADRPDEIERVKKCGGLVLYWQTTYRVNGQLAVSRSIGDADHKSCVISTPDIVSIQLDGKEDFMILACDGLWDCVEPDKAAKLVYDHVSSAPDKYEQTSQLLVEYAKAQGSGDNITTIVVFLTDPRNIKCCDIDMETATAESFSSNQNGATSYRPINNFEHDDDEDFGPETNVDNIDDLMSQPVPTKKSFLDSDAIKTTFSSDAFDHLDDAETKNGVNKEESVVKEILDNGKELNAESEEEEEDDEGWDYFKADANSKQNSSSQKLESSGDLSSNEMDYTLNPEAREFVPVSPTKETHERDSSRSPEICLYPLKNTEKLLKEEFIASSPMKGQEKNMDDVIVPTLDDFQNEIKKRPSNIMPRFDADEFANVDNHELNNGDALLEQSFENVSTNDAYASTRAVFGDDSTFATNLDEVNKELQNAVANDDASVITASDVAPVETAPTQNGTANHEHSDDERDVAEPTATFDHDADEFGALEDRQEHRDAFESEDYPSMVERRNDDDVSSRENATGDGGDSFYSNVTYGRDSGKYEAEKEVPEFHDLLSGDVSKDHGNVFDCLSYVSKKDNTDEVIRRMSSFDYETAEQTSLMCNDFEKAAGDREFAPTTNPFAASVAAETQANEKENAEEKDVLGGGFRLETSETDRADTNQGAVAFNLLDRAFEDATAPQLSEFRFDPAAAVEKRDVEEAVTAVNIHQVETGRPSETTAATEIDTKGTEQRDADDISAQILDADEYEKSESQSTHLDEDVIPIVEANNSGAESPVSSVDMVTPYIHDCTRMGHKPDTVHETVERRRYEDLLPDHGEDDENDENEAATKESDKLEKELRESTGGKTLEFDLGYVTSCNRFEKNADAVPAAVNAAAPSSDDAEFHSLMCDLVSDKKGLAAPLVGEISEETSIEVAAANAQHEHDDDLARVSSSIGGIDNSHGEESLLREKRNASSTPSPSAVSHAGQAESAVSITEALDKLGQEQEAKTTAAITAAVGVATAVAAGVAVVLDKKSDGAAAPKRPATIKKPESTTTKAPATAAAGKTAKTATAARAAPATKTTARSVASAATTLAAAARKPASSAATAPKTTPIKRPSSATKPTTPTTRSSLTASKPTATAAATATRTSTLSSTKPSVAKSPSSPLKSKPATSVTSPRSATAKPITNGDVSSTTRAPIRKPSTTTTTTTTNGVRKITSPTTASAPSSATSKPAVSLATRTSLAPKSKTTTTSGAVTQDKAKPLVKRPTTAPAATKTVVNKDSKDITNKRLSNTTKPTATKIKTESKINTGLKNVSRTNPKTIAEQNQTTETKLNGNA